MIASDNTRDPFYAYGDLDMLEVWREGVRILHLDYPFADWADVVRAAPAKAMGVEPPAFARRRAAPIMILTQARDFTELLLASAVGSHRRARRAPRSTPRRPTTPNSTPWRVSRHEPRL